jgi:hypothetical protein
LRKVLSIAVRFESDYVLQKNQKSPLLLVGFLYLYVVMTGLEPVTWRL